ncbi:alpha/beta-hydrolase [Meredithblackwellia eburnea MCA 4105]
MYSPSSAAVNTVAQLTKSSPTRIVLVLDNRGCGLSSTPLGRYRTSDMARETIAVLDHVGWTGERSFHVVGISLGGMIAQEVAVAVPSRLSSLTLTSSRAGPIPEFPTFKVGKMFLRQLTGRVKGPEHAAALAVDVLFPSKWLDSPDGVVDGKTRRQVLEKNYLKRAQETKSVTAAGKLGQFSAVTSHYVSPWKLSSILSTIPRVHIIVGDEDQLIAPIRSKQLHAMIPGSTLRWVEGGGHTLPIQFESEYHEWLEAVFQEANDIVAKGSALPQSDVKADELYIPPTVEVVDEAPIDVRVG